MANDVSGPDKHDDLDEDYLADDLDTEELELEDDSTEEESRELASRVSRKDPSVRRKIEDMLERRRMREELGLYDGDGYWDDP